MVKGFSLEEARKYIGQESAPYPYEVTTASVRLYARALGYTDPVFYHLEEAKGRGYRGLPCPPGYLGTPVFDPDLCDPIFSGPRSHDPPFPLPPNGLDGGTETEYFDDLCSGDLLRVHSTITDVREREGSLGKMVFVTQELVFRRDDRVVARQRITGIYY